MNYESNNNKENEKIENNITGMNNLKNYIQSMSNQGKGMLMSGAIQIITSLRSDGMMFEKSFKEEFVRDISNIQKNLKGKSANFSIAVLSAMIMIILESDVEKEVNLDNKKKNIAK